MSDWKQHIADELDRITEDDIAGADRNHGLSRDEKTRIRSYVRDKVGVARRVPALPPGFPSPPSCARATRLLILRCVRAGHAQAIRDLERNARRQLDRGDFNAARDRVDDKLKNVLEDRRRQARRHESRESRQEDPRGRGRREYRRDHDMRHVPRDNYRGGHGGGDGSIFFGNAGGQMGGRDAFVVGRPRPPTSMAPPSLPPAPPPPQLPPLPNPAPPTLTVAPSARDVAVHDRPKTLLEGVVVNLVPLQLPAAEERTAAVHLYDLKFSSPDNSIPLSRGKQQRIFERRLRPALETMLPHGCVVHYDGCSLLSTIGALDVSRVAQLGEDGWGANADHELTWRELGRISPEGGAATVRLQVGIKWSRRQPLMLSDLETAHPRHQEFRTLFAGAMETTFASKYHMFGNAYFDRVALLLGKRAPLVFTQYVKEPHRIGGEAWSLAFPIGNERNLQLNSGFKSTTVQMDGKQWLQLDLGFKVTYIATDGLDMIANEVAKAQQVDSAKLWRNGVCEVRLRDFKDYNLAKRLFSPDNPLKFKSKVNNRKYSLIKFTDVPVDEYFFRDSHGDGSGGKISVKQWNERTYGVPLKYGHLPGIETVPFEETEEGGGQKKQVVIPLEYAVLQGAQPVQTKGDRSLTDMEIKITTGGRDGPQIRAARILQVGQSAKGLINEAGSVCQALQVSVGAQAAALSPVPGGAHQLSKPMIRTGTAERPVTGSKGRNTNIRADDGSYYESTRDDHFVQPCAPVRRWMVVSFVPQESFKGGGKGGNKGGSIEGPEDVIRTLTDNLRRDALKKGMSLAPFENKLFEEGGDVLFYDDLVARGPQPIGAIEDRLKDMMEKAAASPRGEPQLVLAIISNQKDVNSKTVKPALDRWSILCAPFVPVICMQVDKARDKLGDQTFSKLNLAKVNARLGGVNTHVSGLLTAMVPTMVLGLDVFHASAGSQAKSISAYVASMNGQCTSYHTALREHKNQGDEKLVDLEEVLQKQLLAFKSTCGHLPHRLVVYRDGIAHSAFASIGEPEIQSIRRVFDKMGISPALVFIVVQKRNLTRLFLRTQPHGSDFYTNVPPGTAVKVVHNANFWLVAHSALQGTARVPSYHILCNEANADAGAAAPELDMDEIVQDRKSVV